MCCSDQWEIVNHVRSQFTQMGDKREDRRGAGAGGRVSPLDQLSGSVNLVVDQLLAEVRREGRESGGDSISDDLLSALYFIFKQPLLHALDLIDRHSITQVTCPAGRELFRVKGASGRRWYLCLLPPAGYCSCPAHVYTVLVKEEVTMCKHMLAVRIAQALGKHNELSVSDEEFAEILRTSEDYS